MKDAHMSPEEAVQTFIDLKAEKAIGMHWGTFILTDEEMDEPPIRLADALQERRVTSRSWDMARFIKLLIWTNK